MNMNILIRFTESMSPPKPTIFFDWIATLQHVMQTTHYPEQSLLLMRSQVTFYQHRGRTQKSSGNKQLTRSSLSYQ